MIFLGLYLTLRGYHSRDGDQAYRLPLLLHWQDPSAFADDPFVRALDAFNPHRGYLAMVDLASRPAGLSAGLAGLFAVTFLATCVGVARLARGAWPEGGRRVGYAAAGLVMAAKAGNLGTNHLFEAMLLDRLVALALGWMALAGAIGRRWVRLPAIAIGLAALVHPSMGLQLAMLLGAGWVAWAIGSRAACEVGPIRALRALIWLAVAMAPAIWLHGGSGGAVFEGLSPEEFRLLSFQVQGPQHLLPHLWRAPQWAAWGCYFAWAVLAMAEGRREGQAPARSRLAVLLGVNLLGLAAAWGAIEVVGDLRVTLFQPFRLATVARGLALVAASGRVLRLWESGAWGRLRVALLVAGLASSDWAMVVATGVELAIVAAAALTARSGLDRPWPAMVCGTVALGVGLGFLARHDPAAGHGPIVGSLSAVAATALIAWLRRGGPGWEWSRGRVVRSLAVAWVVPMAALAAPWLPEGDDGPGRLAVALARRCRFAETPQDDLERLALWCRDHTPGSARFVGPPGPKTFRLWSRRSVVFNRSASPYHAAGLADWAARFRDHVGFQGPTAAFARAYLENRQALEARYDALGPAGLAALADRQGADHVLAAAPANDDSSDPAVPLELLHTEGRWAVYRVRPVIVALDRPVADLR